MGGSANIWLGLGYLLIATPSMKKLSVPFVCLFLFEMISIAKCYSNKRCVAVCVRPIKTAACSSCLTAIITTTTTTWSSSEAALEAWPARRWCQNSVFSSDLTALCELGIPQTAVLLYLCGGAAVTLVTGRISDICRLLSLGGLLVRFSHTCMINRAQDRN